LGRELSFDLAAFDPMRRASQESRIPPLR